MRAVTGRPRIGWLLLALVMTVTACGIPTSGGPTAIAKANVPLHLLNPTTPSTVAATIPPAVAVPEVIYLVAPTQHVVAATRDVQFPANLSEILGALLDGPTATESSAGLQSFLTTTKVSATVTGGIATVNFTTNPVQVVGPNQTLAIAQIVFTATAQPGVTGVVFQIAGQPIDVPTANGAQVPGPVDATAYQSVAPIIF